MPLHRPPSWWATRSRLDDRSLSSRLAGQSALRARAEAARAPLEQAAFLAARSNEWLVAGIAKAMLARISLETDGVDVAVAAARRALITLEVHGVADKPGEGDRARGPWRRPRPR